MKKKISLSTIEVKFNSKHVAPKMTKADWKEVNSYIEKIRAIGRRAGYRVPLLSKLHIVHYGDYVKDNLLGKDYRLICSGQIVYAGFVSNWHEAYGEEITCERCLKMLGKG